MALIHCPECDREISNKAHSCPHCGYPLDNIKIHQNNQYILDQLKDIAVEEIKKDSNAEEEYESNLTIDDVRKQKRHDHTKTNIVIMGMLLFGLVSITLYYFEFKPQLLYKNAIAKLNDGDYDSAISVFLSLDHFKDSEDKLTESYYNKAVRCLRNEKYDEASEILTSIIGYKDSDSLYKESQYQLGLSLMKTKSFEAIDVFSTIIDYKDCSHLLVEAKYNKANTLFSARELNDAETIFKEIQDFKDSKDKIIECQYLNGIGDYNDGEFEQSIIELTGLEYYRDVQSILNNISIYKKYQGTWREPGSSSYITLIISGRTITKSFKLASGAVSNISLSTTIEEDHLKTIDESYYILDGNMTYKNDKETKEYIKISSDTTIPKEVILKNPSIGMNKTQVENSTWGKPTKVNRTTTADHTQEQWVYSNYKYIYFEDGVVTSIQD